jgi:multidrug efflux pump subunit AcrA (membrane-fusion protein)
MAAGGVLTNLLRGFTLKGMDEQRRQQLLQRRQDLLSQQSGAENKRQDAEDRVTMAARALRTPGFPKPFASEVEASERELEEATGECDRIAAELCDTDAELGKL